MTDSLKKMLKSVDWSKMMSNGDARNALVGSALGGLMLGGASLMQDRDPEESKAAPVGDALMGALLGGAAGYGIPKGLALFRDSGTLAPDDDPLKPYSFSKGRYAAGAGIGGAAGAATATGFTLPAVRRALQRHKVRMAADHASSLDANAAMLETIRGKLRVHQYGGPQFKLDDAARKELIEDLRQARRLRRNLLSGVDRSNKELKSFSGKLGILNRTDWSMDSAPSAKGAGRLAKWLGRRTSGDRFAQITKQLSATPGHVKTITPVMRMLRRVGKYGAGTAALGTAAVGGWHLLEKLLGDGSHNNYAK